MSISKMSCLNKVNVVFVFIIVSLVIYIVEVVLKRVLIKFKWCLLFVVVGIINK